MLPPEGNSQGQKVAEVKKYRMGVRKKSLSERVGEGLLGAGLPSAALTAAFNAGSFKRNPKGVLRSAATAGAFGTAIGTIFSNKKKLTLTPVNDPVEN